MPIRIVIADDHEMYRKGFEVLLKKNPEMSIVGEAYNGENLLELIRNKTPDVVITDIQMPVMDGIQACKKIKKEFKDLPVIALTTYNDDNIILDMLEAGAEGYLLKSTTSEELIKAINLVLNGGTYFHPDTYQKVKNMMAKKRSEGNEKNVSVEFTERELEVITLTCKGLSNKEIGLHLHISPRTVEGHKTRIQEKIEGKSVVDIVVYAIKNKIVHV